MPGSVRIAAFPAAEPISLLRGEPSLSFGLPRFAPDGRNLLSYVQAVYGTRTGRFHLAVARASFGGCDAIGAIPAMDDVMLYHVAQPDIEGPATYRFAFAAGYGLQNLAWGAAGSQPWKEGKQAAVPESFAGRMAVVSISSPTSLGIFLSESLEARLLRGPDGAPSPLGLSHMARDRIIAHTFGDGGYPDGLVAIDATGAVSSILAPSSRRTHRGLGIDRSNGDALVWIQQVDRGPAELWTSPFAVDAPGFAPRKIGIDKAFDSDSTFLLAHNGLAVYSPTRGKIRLVRLSDGLGWTLQADPQNPFAYPAGITDDEVWAFTTDDKDDTWPRDIYAFRLDSLGPPTEPNGL